MNAEHTVATIERFNDAFNRHDIDAVMGMMTDDVAFENTSGARFEGQAAVRAVLTRAFELMRTGWFDTEQLLVASDHCVVLWTYFLDRGEPERGTVRGVDVFRVRGAKVAEKLSYIKSEDFVQKIGLHIATA
jgi:ketosteroid isomerase-like protein